MVDLEADGALLLVHGGELADVRELLDELGLGFEEASPSAAAAAAYRDAALVMAGPQFLLDRLEDPDAGQGPIRIAVLEGEARTLRSMLTRGGVEWMVRRPFHPAALRLLLLHCIYQGPEKRRAQRMSVGAAVRLQVGWRKRGALLADISERDCRVLCERKVPVGSRVKLRLPVELMGRRPLVLAGEVVRTGEARDELASHEVCVVFRGLGETEQLQLKELLTRHEQGPAVLSGLEARRQQRNRVADPTEAQRVRRSVITVGCQPGAEDQSEEIEPVGLTATAPSGSERRRDPRHDFRRRIIALGEEATRVLVGRDISLRGMRVDPSPTLHLGDTLQIAIHVPENDTPLVLDVRVDRDDGPDGVVLAFDELSQTARVYLDELIGGLGGVSEAGGDDATVVSQIVEPELT